MCIIHFVAMEVIVELTKLYLEALKDNHLEEVFHKHPKIVQKGRDIKFSERSLFHKLARLLYKLTRCIYSSLVFYYAPFMVYFVLTFLSIAGGGEDSHEESGGHEGGGSHGEH